MEGKLFDSSIKERLSGEEQLLVTSSLGFSLQRLLEDLKIFKSDLKLVTSKGQFVRLTSTYQSSRQIHEDVCLTFVSVPTTYEASTVYDLVHLLGVMLAQGHLPGIKSEDGAIDSKTGVWFEDKETDMGEMQSVGVYEMELSSIEDFPCVCLGVVYSFEPELV